MNTTQLELDRCTWILPRRTAPWQWTALDWAMWKAEHRDPWAESTRVDLIAQGPMAALVASNDNGRNSKE